jgi:hypothetical protein
MDFLNKQIKKIDGGMPKMKGGADEEVTMVKVTKTEEGKYTAEIKKDEAEKDKEETHTGATELQENTDENANLAVGQGETPKPKDTTEEIVDVEEGQNANATTNPAGGARKKKARKSAKKGAKKSAKRKSAKRKSIKKGRK